MRLTHLVAWKIQGQRTCAYSPNHLGRKPAAHRWVALAYSAQSGSQDSERSPDSPAHYCTCRSYFYNTAVTTTLRLLSFALVCSNVMVFLKALSLSVMNIEVVIYSRLQKSFRSINETANSEIICNSIVLRTSDNQSEFTRSLLRHLEYQFNFCYTSLVRWLVFHGVKVSQI